MKIQLQLHYTTLSSSHRTIKPAEQNHKYKEGKKTSIKKKLCFTSADRWCLKTNWLIIKNFTLLIFQCLGRRNLFYISFKKKKFPIPNLTRETVLIWLGNSYKSTNPPSISICSKPWLYNYRQYIRIRLWPGSNFKINYKNKINIDTGRIYRLEDKYVSLNIQESPKLRYPILLLRKRK